MTCMSRNTFISVTCRDGMHSQRMTAICAQRGTARRCAVRIALVHMKQAPCREGAILKMARETGGPETARSACAHDKITRRMKTSKEVWGKLFGTIDTREKFEAHRLQLATNEWERLKANNSLECRNCHQFESMDFTRQSKRASDAHPTFRAKGEKTCIDCRKGIAHQLPDMSNVK